MTYREIYLRAHLSPNAFQVFRGVKIQDSVRSIVIPLPKLLKWKASYSSKGITNYDLLGILLFA
jgi:hypothetical protein